MRPGQGNRESPNELRIVRLNMTREQTICYVYEKSVLTTMRSVCSISIHDLEQIADEVEIKLRVVVSTP